MAAVPLPQEDALRLPTHCILLSPLTSNLPCSADKVGLTPAGKSRDITWTLIFLPTTEGERLPLRRCCPGGPRPRGGGILLPVRGQPLPMPLIPPLCFLKVVTASVTLSRLALPTFSSLVGHPKPPTNAYLLQPTLIGVLPPHCQQFVLSKSPVTSRRWPNLRDVSHLLSYQKVQLL